MDTSSQKGSVSSYAELIARLGFVADPFAKTNADEGGRLASYFIEPPFYSSVFGDPNSPQSSVVFAPRGGGKTALKRKIELSSKGQPLLPSPAQGSVCSEMAPFFPVGQQR